MVKNKDLLSELWLACPIPLAISLIALTGIDPLLGIFFSGHGGLGWVLALVAFPWALARAGYMAFSVQTKERSFNWQKALYVLLMYVGAALLCCLILIWRLPEYLRPSISELPAWFFFPAVLFTSG